MNILITGAGKRIGRSIVESLCSFPGVSFSLHFYSSRVEVENLYHFLSSKGIKADLYQANLSDFSGCRDLIAQIKRKKLPDVFIHSASQFFPTSFSEVTSEDWDALFTLHSKSAFFLTQGFFSKKSDLKDRSVVFISDVYALKPSMGYAPYIASKASLLSLTPILAKELSPHVRVNSICPGPILPPEGYSAEKYKKASDRTLLKRWGSPSDVSHAVKFLIGNKYLTGINLCVDGGRVLS